VSGLNDGGGQFVAPPFADDTNAPAMW